MINMDIVIHVGAINGECSGDMPHYMPPRNRDGLKDVIILKDEKGNNQLTPSSHGHGIGHPVTQAQKQGTCYGKPIDHNGPFGYRGVVEGTENSSHEVQYVQKFQVIISLNLVQTKTTNYHEWYVA
jgi:hypothetical protein